MSQATLAVIIGNRDFFPDVLVAEARRDLVKLLAELDIEPVMELAKEQIAKYGGGTSGE